MRSIAAVCAVVFSATSAADAHQILLNGKRIGPPPMSEESPITKAGEIDGETEGKLRAIIDQYRIWRVGTVLKVCFFGGDKELRKFFSKTALEWDEAAPGISFDFSDANGFYECSDDPKASFVAHIRVSFDSQGEWSGDWSLLGNNAISVGWHEPSMNIGSVVKGNLAETLVALTEDDLKGKIRHEMAHALAMEHEHQSPDSSCEDELLWEQKVYPDLAAPPNEWDRQTVDANLRRLVDSPRLRTTSYDPKSVTHYVLPFDWFRNGDSSACAVSENLEISEIDRQAIKEMYPENREDQRKYLNRLGGIATRVATELGITQERAKGLEAAIEGALPEGWRGRGLAPSIVNCSAVNNQGNVSIIISGDCIIER